MRVVSNTSPVSNLAAIGRLDLLRAQFREVLVPEAVARELENIPRPSAGALIEQAIREGWIRIQAVGQERIIRLLASGLHPGEAEAIALALETGADIVLLDERDGRSMAVRLGLRVTGVLGVLLRAKRTAGISSLRSELEALRSTAGFFIASRLEEEILKSAGE